MATVIENITRINRGLAQTLGLMRGINRERPARAGSKTEEELEEELRRRRLTTNESE